MDIVSHKEFIKKSYEEYKKIGYIECPAFPNEKIYFLKRGFRHLVWKGVNLREVEEQIERINLLIYAPSILKSSKVFKDFNKNKILGDRGNAIVNFWSFMQEINAVKIIVLVRQINDGPKHFFSVMKKDEKHKTP